MAPGSCELLSVKGAGADGIGLHYPSSMTSRIVLVHGVLNAKTWLWPMAARLRRQGFTVDLFGYSSLWEGPRGAVPRLIEKIRKVRADGLLGHSLGGLLSLEALQQAPELPVQRVVCLGSPLRGSETARRVAALTWARPFLGRSSQLLQAGLADWRGNAEVGVVAGDAPRGAGCFFAHFQEPSDGTVALAETRLPWLADHVVLPCSHSGLVLSRQTVTQATSFLRHGRFDHGAEMKVV